MSSKFFRLFTTLFLIAFLGISANAQVYKFSGGPSGGTFQYYASAISTLAKDVDMRVLASSSGGAIENIRLIDANKSSFAVTYSGHVWAALNGKLKNDDKKYENVKAVAYLYGAPAQLVVKQKSGIDSPKQLADKRVGVGNAGSGAAANAEIFFTQLGIWDKMGRENLGYRQAADAFNNNQIDAFWVFVGYPNASIIEAALQSDIKLLDTYKAGQEAGLFEKYPYFSKVVIPANTYKGQEEAVNTFQDAALWVASGDVPADAVYKLLSKVYSDEGLKHMVEVHKSAKAMSIESGMNGIVTPMHPGAEKFWKEKGTLK
ncbi:MAG: TAXI family TRAP transporter solute-binding subunit [Calditrichaeota bacterium]|nr:TAXI family TRAP transporter solute-binding subunit [Calditrichota bacterium]